MGGPPRGAIGSGPDWEVAPMMAPGGGAGIRRASASTGDRRAASSAGIPDAAAPPPPLPLPFEPGKFDLTF